MTRVDFQLLPLSADDQQLVDAYSRIGLSVDDLAYSQEFEALCQQLGRGTSLQDQQAVYRRLLDLRKRGRLPRRYATA